MEMENENETKPLLGSLLNQRDSTSWNITRREHICRICLVNNSTLQSIFETDLDKIIMKCASVKVLKNDQLPSEICVNCVTLLNKAYKFKQLAEDSECILKQKYLGEDTTEKSNAECYKKELIEFKKEHVEDEELTVEHLENSYEEVTDDYSNWHTEIEIVKNEVEEFIDANQYENLTAIEDNSCANNICSIYGRKWKKPTYFNTATSSHSDKNSYKCKISKCNGIFKTKRELNKHVLVHKGQKLKANNHICTICEMAYPKSSALRAHMKVHISTVSYKCGFPNCNKKFKSSTERREHLLNHKGSVIHEEIRRLLA